MYEGALLEETEDNLAVQIPPRDFFQPIGELTVRRWPAELIWKILKWRFYIHLRFDLQSLISGEYEDDITDVISTDADDFTCVISTDADDLTCVISTDAEDLTCVGLYG